MGKQPLFYEAKSETSYILHLADIFHSLKVINGELFLETLDEDGEEQKLLVVPASISQALLKAFHETYGHVETWKLQEVVSRTFYIMDIKSLSRLITKSCSTCILAAYPKLPPARKIRTTTSTAGLSANVDLLYLPQIRTYKYVLLVVDEATLFIMTKKLSKRTGAAVASALTSVLFEHACLFQRISHNDGAEFGGNDFRHACQALGIESVTHNVLPQFLFTKRK